MREGDTITTYVMSRNIEVLLKLAEVRAEREDVSCAGYQLKHQAQRTRKVRAEDPVRDGGGKGPGDAISSYKRGQQFVHASRLGICSNYFFQSRLGIASRIPSFRRRSKDRQQNGARWHPPSKSINEPILYKRLCEIIICSCEDARAGYGMLC